MLPVSTKKIRNTIPNAAKKERKRITIIPQLRFHEFQMVVNCGRREIDVSTSFLFLKIIVFKNPIYVLMLIFHLAALNSIGSQMNDIFYKIQFALT